MAPVVDILEDEYNRRNHAILAVMAYCPTQKSPLPRTRDKIRRWLIKTRASEVKAFRKRTQTD
jgi:hypothetical protein